MIRASVVSDGWSIRWVTEAVLKIDEPNKPWGFDSLTIRLEKDMKDDRYQNQTYWVKCYRWWRYKPIYTVVAYFNVLRYIVSGMPKHQHIFPDGYVWRETRWESIKTIFVVSASMADIKMRHLYDWDEIKREFV